MQKKKIHGKYPWGKITDFKTKTDQSDFFPFAQTPVRLRTGCGWLQVPPLLVAEVTPAAAGMPPPPWNASRSSGLDSSQLRWAGPSLLLTSRTGSETSPSWSRPVTGGKGQHPPKCSFNSKKRTGWEMRTKDSLLQGTVANPKDFSRGRRPGLAQHQTLAWNPACGSQVGTGLRGSWHLGPFPARFSRVTFLLKAL